MHAGLHARHTNSGHSRNVQNESLEEGLLETLIEEAGNTRSTTRKKKPGFRSSSFFFCNDNSKRNDNDRFNGDVDTNKNKGSRWTANAVDNEFNRRRDLLRKRDDFGCWRRVQPILLGAILIGFPLSNAVFFFSTHVVPKIWSSRGGSGSGGISGGVGWDQDVVGMERRSPRFSGKQREGVFPSVARAGEGGDDDDDDEYEDDEVSDDFMEGFDHKKNRNDKKRKGGKKLMSSSSSRKDRDEEILFPELADFLEPFREHYESFFEANSQAWRIKKYGRICLVSDYVLGLSTGSGPATAVTTLAEDLHNSGFDVTLLYTGYALHKPPDLEFWVGYYTAKGINLVALPETGVSYDVPIDVAIAHRVYMWMNDQQWYDCVHFLDNRGRGYFALTAKKQALAFKHTEFVVHAQQPHLWQKTNSLQTLDTLQDLVIDYLEKEQMKMADHIVAPSQYILKWFIEQGWEWNRTKSTRVHTNPLPKWVKSKNKIAHDASTINEIVFFSRFELRKGIVLFCDAMDQLALRGETQIMKGVRVTFLGHLSSSAEEKLTVKGGAKARVDQYIRQRAKKWSFHWQILKDMDVKQRYEYVEEGNRMNKLVVLPSLLENSPYTLVECLVMGIPVVASDVGSAREFIDDDDVDRVLFTPTPKPLAARIREILKNGFVPGKSKIKADVEKDWTIWQHHLVHMSKDSSNAMSTLQTWEEPLVTVIVVTYNNPKLLKQALKSIYEQEYTKIEVVLIDDGSTLPEAQEYLREIDAEFKRKGWIYLQQDNRGPGAARNNGAKHARGDFIMFMDDDNFAKPKEIATFVSVAMHTKADVLTCTSEYFYGLDLPGNRPPIGRWVPLGAATTVGMFQNLYGDTNAMIRRKVFLDLGGFPEDYGYAMEDWELFSKSVLGGYKMESIPSALFWYRIRDTSHSHETAKYGNAARTIRPYLRQIPQKLHHIVLFAQGMKDSHDVAAGQLEEQNGQMRDVRKMLKTLATSLNDLCEDGLIPTAARNEVHNSQFATNEDDPEIIDNPSYDRLDEKDKRFKSWSSFADGYNIDKKNGRISESSADTRAIRMQNPDWKDARGAVQEIKLHQKEPKAVIISGWSKSRDVSGAIDGGYSIYADIKFIDGKMMYGYSVAFDVGTHTWQFKAGVIDPLVAIESITLYVMFRWHAGTVWFDDISVSSLKEGLCDYTKLTLEGLGADKMSNKIGPGGFPTRDEL
jgi:O-antigen biosynthesis protein